MKKRAVPAIVWKEGKWFVAKTLSLELASQGKTKNAALKNLQEALDLFLEEDKLKTAAFPIPKNPEIREVYA